VAVGLREVMVDKSLSIGECCRIMALTLGLEGEAGGGCGFLFLGIHEVRV